MNEKEAIENIKEQLEGIKKANECGLATRGEFNKDINAIETVLNLLEKKDKIIDECRNRLAEKQLTINKLETLAGLALRQRPLEISKKALKELDNTIKIEQTENIMNDSYIFRAK